MQSINEFKSDEAYYKYLRKYYAGQAIAGILANSNQEVCDKTTVNGGWHYPNVIAKLAVEIADATIKELQLPCKK